MAMLCPRGAAGSGCQGKGGAGEALGRGRTVRCKGRRSAPSLGRRADVEKCGGLAALTRDPPMDGGRWPLPRAPETDGPERYRKPPPGNVETELAA